MKAYIISFISVLGMSFVAGAAQYDIYSPEPGKNCSTVSASGTGQPGLKIRQCQQDLGSDPRFLLIKTQFGELPQEVQHRFKGNIEINNWDQVYLSIFTENDDIGLLGICKAKDKSCVDDLGYTIGSSMTFGGTYQNRYEVQLKVANALYSQFVPGTWHEDARTKATYESQHIRSALMVEFLVNSVKKDSVYYWSAGTGMIGLSSTAKFGILDAAKQQRTMHQIMNSISSDLAVTRTNLDDGEPDSWGFYLMAGLGVQKLMNVGSSGAQSKSYAQISTRLSTLRKHSELRLEAGTEISYPLGANHRAGVGASVASTAHSEGLLNEGTIFVKLESGKSWETTVGLTCQRGKLANFAKYNLPNIETGRPDCLYRLNLKYYVQ